MFLEPPLQLTGSLSCKRVSSSLPFLLCILGKGCVTINLMSFLCLPPPSRRESFNSEVMATFLVRVATAMIRQHYQKQVGK